MLWKLICQNALKKAGFSESEIEAGLSNLETEVEDTVATQRLSSIFTADEARGSDAIFGSIKAAAKAEALNGVDAELKDIESLYTADQKTKYAALGNNTHAKVKFAKEVLKEQMNKKTGDENYDQLKESWDTLNSELATKYVKVEEHEGVKNKLTAAQRDNFNSRFLNAAKEVVKKDETKKSRHFATNFIQDAQSLLEDGIPTTPGGTKKQKGVIDFDSGKIMRADSPEQPLQIGTEILTVEKLAELTAEYGKYNEGYVAPPSDLIQIPSGGNGGTLSNVQARVRQDNGKIAGELMAVTD